MKRVLAFAFFCSVTTVAFAQKYRAVLTTSYGKVVLELYDQTPKHEANFVKLGKEHFYDGTLFHRVIPGFMIQGGDPESKEAQPGQRLGNGDVGYRIDAEIRPEYFHRRGALAAARDNNPEKASSGCQFYIVQGKKFTPEELKNIAARTGHTFTPQQERIYETVGGAPHLDGNYTVFGQVLKGMTVVDKIAEQERDSFDRPKKDQEIIKLRIRKRFLFLWL